MNGARSLLVPGLPVAQPRRTSRGMRLKSGAVARVDFVPKSHPIHGWRALITGLATAKWAGRPPLDGPVQLKVVFLFPRPGRLVWKRRPMPIEPHVAKPDADNLVKAVKDALKGIAWLDDCQVCLETVGKAYVRGGEGPRTLLQVLPAGEHLLRLAEELEGETADVGVAAVVGARSGGREGP